jgi:CRISPR/Cas system-associated exonuclease Cas4 (RecB family)
MTKERLAPIRASEVGEFVFCARAWWLRRALELEPAGRERRERGTLLHQRHGRVVAASNTLVWLALALVVLAFAAMVVVR